MNLLLRIFVVLAPYIRSPRAVLFAFAFVLGVHVALAGNTTSEPWPATVGACESLVEKLERSSGCVIRGQELWVRKLYQLSRANPDCKQIRWRALYWDAVSRHDRKDYKNAVRLIKQAELLVDRRRFEYDYMRISRSRALFELTAANDLYGLYKRQCSDLDYFTSVDDDKTVGSCHLVMGKVFLDLGEPLQALRESRVARRFFVQSATPALCASAEMNIALCHLVSGHYAKGLAILKRLERSRTARMDAAFHTFCLLNISYSYSQTGTLCPEKYIRRMERLVIETNNLYVRQMCNINIGAWYYRRKHYDKAISLLSSALRYARQENHVEWLANCYRGLAECYNAKGNTKKAASFYTLYAVAVDSLQTNRAKAMVMDAEEYERIRQLDYAVYKAKEAARTRLMRTLAISAFALMALAGVCLWLWYRHKRAAIQLMQEKMDNERKRLVLEAQSRRIAAGEIEVQDKANALRQIRSLVDDAGGNVGVGSDIGRRIKAQAMMHAGADMGWDEFKETFSKVYPLFFSRIKLRHPLLTEYDLRLCTYIMAGVENKRIAMLMNVLPESLKKSRTRLRKKLAISSDIDLGDYLRGFNRPNEGVDIID